MDKISNINFTGISNIGFAHFRRQPGAKGAVSKSISMVLRDDTRGQDFSEFKAALRKVTKSPHEYYFDTDDPNILNVECYSDRSENLLMLNGNVLNVDNKTMPLFTYIAKLTRRIANMPEKDMVINKDYVTYEAQRNLIYGDQIKLDGTSYKQQLEFFSKFFEKDSAKYGAEQVNDFIQKIMNKFFEV